jgi:hypothetical protein
MFGFTVTPELLAAIFAALAAILFDWLPGLKEKYDPLSELKKRQIMGVVLALIVLCIYGGSCWWGLFQTGITCDKAGLSGLLNMVWVAISVNQSFHKLFKPAE